MSWYKKAKIEEKDIKENTRFFDPRDNQRGTLYTYTFEFPPHITVWRMRYDSGEIQDLHYGDLERLELE
jgi:hypothetical protein